MQKSGRVVWSIGLVFMATLISSYGLVSLGLYDEAATFDLKQFILVILFVCLDVFSSLFFYRVAGNYFKDKDEPIVGSLLMSLLKFFPALFLMLVMIFITGLSLLAFAIPMFYVGPKIMFAIYDYMIEDSFNVFESIKRSWIKTKGNWGTSFLLFIGGSVFSRAIYDYDFSLSIQFGSSFELLVFESFLMTLMFVFGTFVMVYFYYQFGSKEIEEKVLELDLDKDKLAISSDSDSKTSGPIVRY